MFRAVPLLVLLLVSRVSANAADQPLANPKGEGIGLHFKGMIVAAILVLAGWIAYRLTRTGPPPGR